MRTERIAAYKLIGELFLPPEARRDPEALLAAAAQTPEHVGVELASFIVDEGAWCSEHYIQTLELSPPCPLYLGAYLFDEPRTCNGVGRSGRNAYMIELRNIYRHFGLELAEAELPDYVPAVVDFLWLSLERAARDRIGLRRLLLERYVHPALAPFEAALARHDSGYASVAGVLRELVVDDCMDMSSQPRWTPAPAGRSELSVLRDDAAAVAVCDAHEELGP